MTDKIEKWIPDDVRWIDELEQEYYNSYYREELLPHLPIRARRTHAEEMYDMGWVEEEIIYFEDTIGDSI